MSDKKSIDLQLKKAVKILSIFIFLMVVIAGAASAAEINDQKSVTNVDDFIDAMNDTNIKSIMVEPDGEFNLEDAEWGKIITKPVTFSKSSSSSGSDVKLGGVTIDSGVTVTIDKDCDSKFSVSKGKLTISVSADLVFDNNDTSLIKDLKTGEDGQVKVINNGTVHFGANCDGYIMQDFLDYGIDGRFLADDDLSDGGIVVVSKGVLIRPLNHTITIEIPKSDSIFTVIDDNSTETRKMPFGNKIDTYKIVGLGKFIIKNMKDGGILEIYSKVTISTEFKIETNNNYDIKIYPTGQLNVYGNMNLLGTVTLYLEDTEPTGDESVASRASFGYGGSVELPTNFFNKNYYSLKFDYDDSLYYLTPAISESNSSSESLNMILYSGLEYRIAGLEIIKDEEGKIKTKTATAKSKGLNIDSGDDSTYIFTLNNASSISWYLYQEKMIPEMVYLLDNNGVTFTARSSKVSQKIFWYQENTADVLTRGYDYQTDDCEYSFYVPEYGSLFLKKDDIPAGKYYHFLGNGNDEYDQIVIVSEPELSLKNISEKVLYRSGDEKETVVRIKNEADLPMKLAFVKNGLNTFQSTIPGTKVESESDGVFRISIEDNAELGIWTVYAHIQGLVSEAGNYAYVPVGDITIYSSKSDESAVVTSMKPVIIDDGCVSEIFLEATGGRKVYVTFYDKDAETVDDAEKMTTDSKHLKLVKNQANLKTANGEDAKDEKIGEYFVVPDNNQLTIGIKGDTGALSQKNYMILIKVEGYREDLPGGDKNPLENTLTVNGNKFTIKLDKDIYTLGDDLKVSGTYNPTGDFGLSFYIEGTNIPMTKLHVPDKINDDLAGSNVKAGEYYYYLDSKYSGSKEGEDVYSYNMSTWNPGIYTLYASTFNNNYPAGKNDFTVTDKTNILEKATTLTVQLVNSMITIESIPKEVETGFTSSGNSNYMTINVKAESADVISLYIIGQNKMFYINGKDALKDGYVKNLSESDTTKSYAESGGASENDSAYNYLYYNDSRSINKYWYSENDGKNTPATDKSLKKILNNLGKKDAFNLENANYPEFLIINNMDGTFTVYLHLSGSDENENTSYKEEKGADNQLQDGQYYLVVQNPMADKIFNTYAEKASSNGYTTGVDVFTNGDFIFNVPALENIQAVQKLMSSIENGGDKCSGSDFFVVSPAEGNVTWNEPLESYEQGDFISMGVSGINDKNLLATMELNQFTLEQSNINVIQSFIPSKSGKDSVTWTFTLDTKGIPLGTYDIIVIDEDNKVLKTFKTKIVEATKKDDGSTKGSDTELVIQGQDEVKVGSSCSYTVVLSGKTREDIEWKVSDTSLADIDTNGKFTAKNQGKVIVKATDTKTGMTAEKSVTIVQNVDSSTDSTEKNPKSPAPIFGVISGLIVSFVLLKRKR